jgi:hypothetical protein
MRPGAKISKRTEAARAGRPRPFQCVTTVIDRVASRAIDTAGAISTDASRLSANPVTTHVAIPDLP